MQERGDPARGGVGDDRLADAERVRAGAEALDVPLDAVQIDTLLHYRDALVRWNAVHNLTAVRDPGAMIVQHLLDCLAVIAPLRRIRPDPAPRVLDVGSGAGLPGAVIAVALPHSEVVCVDAVAKKVGFVRQVAADLALPNLGAVHSRVEQLVAGRFDVVCARAFGTLADLASLTAAQLADGGVWLAMKGQRPEDEIVALPADAEVFHVELLQVPGLDAMRCIVWMRRRVGGPKEAS